jgi:hypothetical protein
MIQGRALDFRKGGETRESASEPQEDLASYSPSCFLPSFYNLLLLGKGHSRNSQTSNSFDDICNINCKDQNKINWSEFVSKISNISEISF